MTRWMFPYIGFMSLVALAGGILNTWKRFAVPAASPVLLNLTLILSIVVARPGSSAWASSRSTRSAWA
jgi:putative peptidoglycan lipid II flippase